MKSIFSIFDQNKGADITAENPIKVEAESYGFEDMCICPDDITGTGSASCCIDRKDFKMWMKNLVMKILFLNFRKQNLSALFLAKLINQNFGGRSAFS